MMNWSCITSIFDIFYFWRFFFLTNLYHSFYIIYLIMSIWSCCSFYCSKANDSCSFISESSGTCAQRCSYRSTTLHEATFWTSLNRIGLVKSNEIFKRLLIIPSAPIIMSKIHSYPYCSLSCSFFLSYIYNDGIAGLTKEFYDLASICLELFWQH